jgi:hypothetical protein
MARRPRSDSTDAIIDDFGNAGKSIPLPAGVVLRDETEKVIWDQFCKARSRSAWRDFDLVILAKVVRLEADIRRHQETLDKSGPLIRNKRETLIENPLLRVVDTLQRQQLALIRSMSLTQTGNDPRTLNASSDNERDAVNALGNDSLESLLARPLPN